MGYLLNNKHSNIEKEGIHCMRAFSGVCTVVASIYQSIVSMLFIHAMLCYSRCRIDYRSMKYNLMHAHELLMFVIVSKIRPPLVYSTVKPIIRR
jgi:hypothetical protein